ELPAGEAFFPAASVGYSRVIVKNIANDTVTTGGAGIQMHEFYTAKDYPLSTRYTSIKKVNTGPAERLLKFAGLKNFFQPGFTQGYYIELNDMHGKQKAVSSFMANADVNNTAPVERTEYYYSTTNGYRPNSKNKLNSEVEVFY